MEDYKVKEWVMDHIAIGLRPHGWAEEKAKRHSSARLVIPYRHIADLEAVLILRTDDCHVMYITKGSVEKLGTTFDNLWAFAVDNLDPSVLTVEEALKLVDEEMEEIVESAAEAAPDTRRSKAVAQIVVTDETEAAGIILKAVQNEVREKLGGDAYICFPTRHEAICVPKTDEDYESIRYTHNELYGDDAVSNPEERLSPHIYEFGEDGGLVIAVPHFAMNPPVIRPVGT